MENNNDINTKLLVKEEGENEEKLRKKLLDESKKLWVVAGPAIFTRFSTFGISIISQAFIGHIGSTELAAYSLVFTVLLKFANGALLGMASGLETLCGQAYGAKQYHMLGIYLQRSWVVLVITSLFLLPVFLLTAPILKLLGQQDEIADVAGLISQWMIPVLFSFVASFTCQMFLQSQSKNSIIAYLAAASLSIHLFLSWILVVKFNWGLRGAMTSMIIAYWIPNVGQLLFVTSGGCPQTWNGFSLLAFKDLWLVIKLSLSSGAMVCLELWYNSILVLLTGNMKNAEVAIDALAICININGWETMISFGFLGAASVRVANELGRGSSKAAKFAIMVVVLTSLSIGVVLFVFFLFLRGRLAYIFTEDKAVAATVGKLSPLLAFSILLNSVQPVLSASTCKRPSPCRLLFPNGPIQKLVRSDHFDFCRVNSSAFCSNNLHGKLGRERERVRERMEGFEKVAITEAMEVDKDDDASKSTQIIDLLRKFLDVQKRRAEAYAKLRRGFNDYMVGGGDAAYQQICREITEEFSDCSKQVLEMESLFLNPELCRDDLARLLKSVQAQEKEKLHLTATIQVLKKAGRPSERLVSHENCRFRTPAAHECVHVNEITVAAGTEEAEADAEYDGAMKEAIRGVQDAVMSINEHLEEVRYEIEALEAEN